MESYLVCTLYQIHSNIPGFQSYLNKVYVLVLFTSLSCALYCFKIYLTEEKKKDHKAKTNDVQQENEL